MAGTITFPIDADVLAQLGKQAEAESVTVTELLATIAEQMQAKSTRGRRDTLLEKIVRLYAAGWSDDRIAAAVFCSASTVQKKRRALGLPPHKRAKVSPVHDWKAMVSGGNV